MKSSNENVKKRKAYYGFSKNYPGRVGSSKYVIGDSRAVQKREVIRSVVIALITFLIFSVSFIVTDVCFNISEL